MNIARPQFVFLLAMVLNLCWAIPAEARKYLTREQAEKICFPNADKVEWKSHRYTQSEITAIYKASNLKVIDMGIWYGVALKENKIIGVLAFDRSTGKHEFIDYIVALTPEGKVKQIEILEYRESWGYEVRREGWRKQFTGKDSTSKLKLNDGIHNISGATLSCRGITRGVKRICHTWEVLLRPALVSAGRLPKLATGDGR